MHIKDNASHPYSLHMRCCTASHVGEDAQLLQDIGHLRMTLASPVFAKAVIANIVLHWLLRGHSFAVFAVAGLQPS